MKNKILVVETAGGQMIGFDEPGAYPVLEDGFLCVIQPPETQEGNQNTIGLFSKSGFNGWWMQDAADHADSD